MFSHILPGIIKNHQDAFGVVGSLGAMHLFFWKRTEEDNKAAETRLKTEQAAAETRTNKILDGIKEAQEKAETRLKEAQEKADARTKDILDELKTLIKQK